MKLRIQNKDLQDKTGLIGDQLVFVIDAPASRLHRLASALSSLVLLAMTVAAIAAVSIWQWEQYRPRVTVLIQPAAPAKACGVPV
ncbi:MAG: hypothetical protein DI551_00705 [Micavibrio aeruginosavorus]|uniref:Uncharacterized protein n=1 Tax=Micavibrio aeruginosavorus TaxID=349221 RepID=A0A2W5Q298_9BACT|nr:MAG: hypothetical protein DI551_00705 [Micavibrio aeruginosavorus]